VLAFELDGLERRYGSRVALAPLTLSIERGETVALVGPSGAGKTTLLHLLAGLVPPTSGSVRVLGRVLAELPPRARAERVGLIPQHAGLVPNLSVVHNVLAGNLGRWGLLRSLASLVWPGAPEPARSALARVGLEGRMHERAYRLSGGEQQRVALARLLVQRPHTLLADEPVASLDPARAGALVRLLVAMAAEGGHTLVASLHAVDLALAHFGRVIGMRGGVVRFDLPASAVGAAALERLYDLGGDPAPGEVAPEPSATSGHEVRGLPPRAHPTGASAP
jgi:phosphonate transport system ATP-binding protein